MLNKYLVRSAIVTTAFLAGLLCLASSSHADAVFGEVWQLRQPDGTMVDCRIWGDEFYQDVESLDGYTLMRDPGTCEIMYARLSPDGNALVSTGVRVETARGEDLGLEKHIRINPRAKGEAIASARARVRQMGEESAAMRGMTLSMVAPPSTGDVEGICLIIDFPDQVATIPRNNVVQHCNDIGYTRYGNNGSVYEYFLDVSDGALRYTNWVAAAYHRAPNNFTWYDDCAQPWLERGVNLIADILDSLDADGFDFSQYDANGDGFIDAVNAYYAGSTACGWALGMWPGSGYMTWASDDGVQTLKFQISGMGASLSIGTFLHENGHMLCLWPDLYDYARDSAGGSYGVGTFCIMCSRTSNTNPEEPCAYLKSTAGWVTPTGLAGFQTGLTVPTANNFCYKINNPSLANEYYLIENRQKEGRDIDLEDDGLAIWHIDTNGNNSLNHMLPDSHYVVTLVQADGLWEYERNLGGSDNTDLWAAPDYVNLSPCTNPNDDWWDGSESGFMITDISASASVMTFTFSPSNEAPVAQCRSYSVHATDPTYCVDVDVGDVNDGSYDPNGETDLDEVCITAVDGSPVGCLSTAEVCGKGSHAVTLRARDVCAAASTCDATVEITNAPPIAQCKPFTADGDEDCCITVDVTDINDGSYDPDGAGDIASLCITAVDGSSSGCEQEVQVCGEGMHTVTLTITDICGESDDCVASVEVVDVTPPEVTITLNRDVLWPPNHKTADIVAEVEVSDNCDSDPEWVLVDITSDEPENGTGDGDTPDDIQGASYGTPDLEFRLRSERKGNSDGRVYSIVYAATDNAGNVGVATVYVRVPHDQSGTGLASLGFSPDGASFDPGSQRFALVIPSRSDGFDATRVSVARAYVGNLKGVIVPVDHIAIDATQDGLIDLALWYSVEDAQMIFGNTVASAENHWLNVAFDPEIPDLPPDPADLLAGFGPVGLHYGGPNGVDYLVPNIFQLGEPVQLEVAMNTSGVDDRPVGATDLLPIYPNPFVRSTTIPFNLAAPGRATLRIYDVRGVIVRTLQDGDLPAGLHEAVWNGCDVVGQHVAAGIYFARLSVASHQTKQKLLLLK